MVTGASSANLAIILIDARKGVIEQTKRHSLVASLLGIPHVVICINKMDLVDYNEADFSKTKLMSGSYNISKTAELTQFDNMFTYKGEVFSQLFKDFKGEFDNLWSLNRDSDDLPTADAWKRVTEPYNGKIYLHTKVPVALTWKEVAKVRRSVAKLAPAFFRNAYKKRDCIYYSLETKLFTGCPK